MPTENSENARFFRQEFRSNPVLARHAFWCWCKSSRSRVGNPKNQSQEADTGKYIFVHNEYLPEPWGTATKNVARQGEVAWMHGSC